MSAVIKPDGIVKSIAENLGIQVTDEALRSLSLDVDYRIRELVQVRILEYHSSMVAAFNLNLKTHHGHAGCQQGGPKIEKDVHLTRRCQSIV